MVHYSISLLYSCCLLLLLLLFPQSLHCINPNEACPIYPQITANPNIVHTRQSPVGQRPWVVLVWISCQNIGSTTCEGSLIDEDWVLTTAKCFQCPATDASIVVDVGLHYNDIRKEMSEGRGSHVERIGAYKVHIHPRYNMTDSSSAGSDIALIHLIKKVNSSFVVNMADCNQKKLTRTVGKNCLSAGWGDDGSMTISPSTAAAALELHPAPYHMKAMTDVYMGLWSAVACESATGLVQQQESTLICAGAKLYSNVTSRGLLERIRVTKTSKAASPNPAAAPCHVQLGAGLVISQPMVATSARDGQVEIKCEWQLCGVLAHGMYCDEPDIPGRYTDVCAHEEWIHDTMRVADERILNLEGCPTLPSPPVNGYLCGLDDVASGRVQFCCERGYELQGPSISVCDRANRQWTPNTGRCTSVSCPELVTPPHGVTNPTNCRNSSYTMGCWFKCGSGYTLKGTELLICQEDGTWSNVVPNCEAIDCGPPPHGGNLLVHYTGTTYQSVVSYHCRTCYQLVNRDTSVNRTCGSNGRWNGSFPVCKLVHCQMLEPPQYGLLIETSNTCGSEIRFQCMEGFVMIGNNRATCLSTGFWSNDTPFCVSASCPHPVVESSVNFLLPTPDNPPPQNYSYGDSISIVCQECHKPVRGDVNMTCLQGGVWDGSPPVCEWVTCPLPSFLPNGQIVPFGNMYFCGTKVRFRCYPGYNLIGSTSTTCTDTGEWSHSFPECKSLIPEAECSIFKVHNGRVSISHTGVGGVANVSCSQCYSLEGSGILKCTETMEWDKPIPTCKRRQCPDIGALQNGYIIKQSADATITCNDVLFFGCDNGYELEGPLATTCLYDGQWSHPAPICKAIRCTIPPNTDGNSYICKVSNNDNAPQLNDSSNNGYSYDDGLGNGNIIQDHFFLPGTTIEYCCNRGTVVKNGQKTLTCMDSGKWDQPANPLYCELNGCPLESATSSSLVLANASHPSLPITNTTSLYPSGSTLHWECRDPNMVMYGSAVTVCEKDRHGDEGQPTWNHHLPQCINSSCIQTCPNPSIPDNGRIISISNNKYSSYGGISEGTVVLYMCDRDYHLHGSILRKCLINGVWSGQKTMCFGFKMPESKVIIQHPETKQWQSVSTWHFMTSQQVYLACQTFNGRVVEFRKIHGSPIDTTGVRISEFGEDEKSRQLLMKPTSLRGAKSIAGTYMCEVAKGNNTIQRTVDVYMHEHFCSFPNVPEESKRVLGLTPESCHHILCNNTHHGITESSNNEKAFRMCLSDGKWSEGLTECIIV